MTFEKGSTIMTNETRDAIGEGGRGLSLSLVVDGKGASEKLKTQSDSLPPKSDSQPDSNANSLSDSDSLTSEERLAHLAKTYSTDKGTAELTSPNTAPLIPTRNNWDEIHDMLNGAPPTYTYHDGRIQLLSGKELESAPTHFTVEDGWLPDCNINDNGTADYE